MCDSAYVEYEDQLGWLEGIMFNSLKSIFEMKFGSNAICTGPDHPFVEDATFLELWHATNHDSDPYYFHGIADATFRFKERYGFVTSTGQAIDSYDDLHPKTQAFLDFCLAIDGISAPLSANGNPANGWTHTTWFGGVAFIRTDVADWKDKNGNDVVRNGNEITINAGTDEEVTLELPSNPDPKDRYAIEWSLEMPNEYWL